MVQSSTGTAGGITMVWSLTQMLKLPQVLANGTSLPTQLCGNSMAVLTLAQGGCVDVPAALLICVPGALTAIVGARVAHRLPEATLQLLFAGALLVAGPIVLWRLQRPDAPSKFQSATVPVASMTHDPCPSSPASQEIDLASRCRAQGRALTALVETQPAVASKHMAAGCVMGFAMGAVSVGAGPILMTYFALATEDTPQKVALGTTNCAMLPALLTGSLTHLRSGGIAVRLLPMLCVGTVIGGCVGASIALRVPEDWLKGALGVFLPFAGFLVGRKGWRKFN